jgi:hypothetical protein
MLTPEKLITTIVIDILNEPISSEKNFSLGGSKNTFCRCIDRNIGVGKKVHFMLNKLLVKHPEKIPTIKSYLEESLTPEEQDYFKNLNDIKDILDILDILDIVVNKINATKKTRSKISTTNSNNIKILTIFELLELGWTIENYMKGCFNLWYNYTHETEDFGTVQQWSKIITTHPHNRRILVNDKNELIGFWDFVTLFKEDYEKAKQGNLVDADFDADKMPFFLPGTHNIFVTSILLRKDYRGILLKSLLFSLLKAFEKFASEGIFINEILTWAYSDSGISLSRSLGLKFLCEHKEEGEIYIGSMKNLIKHPLAKDFTVLNNLYKQNNQF